MKEFLKNKALLNKILGIIYIAASAFYLFDMKIPFCISMIVVILLLCTTFPTKQENDGKTPAFGFREIGLFIFSIVLIAKLVI